MSEPLCRLQIHSRQAVSLAPGLVEDGADMLGLPPSDRVRLRALAVEVLEAVLDNAFEPGQEDVDLTLEINREPGVMKLVLKDRGAPLDFGSDYPPRVADLVRLGFADGLVFSNEGRAGNRTEITKGLQYDTINDDAQFIAETEAHPTVAPTIGDDGQVVVDIRAITPAGRRRRGATVLPLLRLHGELRTGRVRAATTCRTCAERATHRDRGSVPAGPHRRASCQRSAPPWRQYQQDRSARRGPGLPETPVVPADRVRPHRAACRIGIRGSIHGGRHGSRGQPEGRLARWGA